MSTTIIAGAGHAGGQTAISLRQAGYDGRIIVCGAEPAPPYQRPPLSKKYLSGELARERVFLRPESFWSRHDVELRLGNGVRQVDPAQRTVVLDDGGPLPFTDLVIATGSRPRRLDVPGADLGNIFYLRTLEDADAIGNALMKRHRLVVVGGGYIGLEIASTAKGLGLEVMALFEALGKAPVRCAAAPGYIIPRLQSLLMAEACRMVEEGVATPADIDRAILHGFGPRYATLGVMEFIDWGGVDILYYAGRYLAQALDSPRHAPPETVARMMEDGRKGLRAGQGYYDFRGMDADAWQKEKLRRLVDLLKGLGQMPPPGV